jgi:hypothetical protein
MQQFEKERLGWNLYYRALDSVEQALLDKDPFVLHLQQKARAIINDCKIKSENLR